MNTLVTVGEGIVANDFEIKRIMAAQALEAAIPELVECFTEVLYEYERAGYCASPSLITRSRFALIKAGYSPK